MATLVRQRLDRQRQRQSAVLGRSHKWVEMETDVTNAQSPVLSPPLHWRLCFLRHGWLSQGNKILCMFSMLAKAYEFYTD